MDRRKMDFPDCSISPLNHDGTSSRLTAYAIRSPLGSEESGVGCPRVVVGDAAQIASAHFSNVTALCSRREVPETSAIVDF
jgi:hypothetical protein